MNTRLGEGNVVRAAKRILGFAGLACLALVCAGADYAQSKPTPAGPAAARPVATAPDASPGTQSPGVTPAAGQVVAQNSAARPAAPKGQSEGIKVHGHWTIEVKNPDGTVATHREFENSLVQPLGANMLENLLLGVYTPRSYEVDLLGTVPSQTPPDTNPPCLNGTGVSPCEILENLPPCAPVSQFLVCTLTRTPALGVAANGPPGQAITFQGTIPAAQPGAIGGVRLTISYCINATTNMQSSFSPLDCSAGAQTSGAYTTQVTFAQLATGVQITAAGQTLSVTVALSFQ